MLSTDEEQKIVMAAKNICRGMSSRRRTLCHVQQRITNLSAQYRSLKKGQKLEGDTCHSTSLLNSSFGQDQKALKETSGHSLSQQREELMK
ncbi:unnamed protein product [Gongylonema pulchrum]|uniref:Myb_CC_LHEQLE domain-containing protein n=1 Tax=Gongylonema pulchrum TaxID=637853 RepID=A0A183DE26_9BILA|nr:unnamed protein product [Gongylonema pulchrum]